MASKHTHKKQKLKRFIVKVQLSLESSDGVQHCLIYNKARDIQWQGIADESIKKEMGKDPKRFYKAHLEGTIIRLDEQAEWQEW